MSDPTANKRNVDAKTPAPIGPRIISAMQHLGVQGSPKNYELFYDALTGINTELNSDFWALGRDVTQEQLDALYEKHYGNHDGHLLIGRVRDMLDEKIRMMIDVLQNEQNSMSAYGEILDEAAQSVSANEAGASENFMRAIETLTNATGQTLGRAQQPLSSLIENLNELEALKSDLEEYKQLAETDSLTGAWNRRAFDDCLATAGTAKRKKAALLIIDIDHFKSINDTYGHPFGDVVIRDVARLIRFNCRDDVFVARAGGEEFAVLLFDAEVASAATVADRLLKAVENNRFSHEEIAVEPGRVTISVGVCSMPPAKTGADLYALADQALYLSKKNGRNRVTLHEADGWSAGTESDDRTIAYRL